MLLAAMAVMVWCGDVQCLDSLVNSPTTMPYFKRDLESQKIWEVGDYVAVYFINQSDANADPRGIDAAWEP